MVTLALFVAGVGLLIAAGVLWWGVPAALCGGGLSLLLLAAVRDANERGLRR